MHFVMQPGMVYQYPLWGVGLPLAGVAARLARWPSYSQAADSCKLSSAAGTMTLQQRYSRSSE